MNVSFFKHLVQSIQGQKTCEIIADTENNEVINIQLVKGNIVYFTCGKLKGVKAVTSSRNQKIVNYQIQENRQIEIPIKPFPFSTQSVLKILSSTLPDRISYNPEEIVIAETHLESNSNSQVENHQIQTGERVRAFEPNSKLAKVELDNALEFVHNSLRKVFGPIADIIYQEAISEVPLISTHKDLAKLINLICLEIQNEELKYQKQFLNSIKNNMANLLNIRSF